MKLYFVRHGQTDANIGRENADPSAWLDGPLTELGIEQAKQTALELKDIKFDAIISSPLKRALQTAEYVNKYHKLPLKIDRAWRERDAEVYADINMWNDVFDFDKNIELKNGESLTEFFERVYEALDNLKQEYPSKTVLIASHGGVQHALYAYANQLPWTGNIRISPMKNCEWRVYDL
jgi:broad specificity phosphatase PhoE